MNNADDMARERGYAGYQQAPGYVQAEIDRRLYLAEVEQQRKRLVRTLAEDADNPTEVFLGAAYLVRGPDDEDHNQIRIYVANGPFGEPYPVVFDPYELSDFAGIGAVLATEAQVYRQDRGETP